ncbi:HET-domain-containing protein [Xylariaceae sp. FL0255]|nr:HET-domain-containing protein [Xylariaceae sp. FL0255]
MRLLDVILLTLHEFFEPNIPSYAILSHTWGTDEILFDDIVHRLGHKKEEAFSKVRKACELAQSNGYQYIWIDTCCINKSSSAELTEAINSMYRWYKDSDVCYVFINDVAMLDSTGEVVMDERLQDKQYPALPAQLRSSRWFTRGWTLQELLAPNKVEFYCSRWSYIGNKKDKSLCLMISEITAIDEGVLKGEGPDIHDVSIARRMYWASKRQTTRVEDLAYCLLGIFDINMPLIYGEGQKAFRRLQEEVLKISDDQSIFAWHNYAVKGSAVDVLAPSPAQFMDSGSISLHNPLRWNRKATSITNQGIALELPLLSAPNKLNLEFLPYKEVDAILDCQLGNVPGTFPTIRLRSVEGQSENNQKYYYRVMIGEEMTIVRHHEVSDLIYGDVVGFDPTQLTTRDIYERALDNINCNWKVETIVIVKHVPNHDRDLRIPWALSLLNHHYPPDDTPFWVLLFSEEHVKISIDDVSPREMWDQSVSQMRVPSIPKDAFSRGKIHETVGDFKLTIRYNTIFTKKGCKAKELKVEHGAILTIGRRSADRRSAYIEPWCRASSSYTKVDEILQQSLFPEEVEIRVDATVRPMEVSGRFYHMVCMKARWKGINHYRGSYLIGSEVIVPS